MPKNVQTTAQLHSSHISSKDMLKISKLGFNSMWTKNFQMYKLDLKKVEEPRSNCQHPLDHRKRKNSRKTSTSASFTMLKPLIVWITTNCGKLLKRWEYQTTLPVSWEICMQVKKQQLEPDMEQWTGSKLEKECIKAVYCHSAYLTYMQSTSWEIQGWMIHSCNQDCHKKYQQPQICRWCHSNG